MDTSNVTNMMFMFYACDTVQTLDLSSFDTSNVWYMSAMFQNCGGLKHLNVSTFNTENVREMWCMFTWCINLRSIDISSFDMTNAKYYDKMFIESSNSSYLYTKIKVSNTFKPSSQGFPTPSPDKIPGADGYWYNSKGEKFLPTEIPENVADTYYAVKPELTAYAVYSEDDNSLEFFKRAIVPQVGDKSPTGKSVSEVYTGFETENYTINWGTGDTTIPWNDVRFMIKTVFIIDKISPVSTKLWFYRLSNCVSFNLQKLNTENVSDMSEMFMCCFKVEKLDLSNFNTSNVLSMCDMFHGCYNLIDINISSFDTSNCKNMFWMFRSCLILKTLNLSSFDMSNIKQGEDGRGMFYECP